MSDSKPVLTTRYRQPLGDKLWRRFVIGVPYFWLLLFFLAPFAIVFKISFATPIVALPPFTQLFDFWHRYHSLVVGHMGQLSVPHRGQSVLGQLL